MVDWTVRKAYKQKVLNTHPDKLPPEATAEERQAAHDEFGKVRSLYIFPEEANLMMPRCTRRFEYLETRRHVACVPVTSLLLAYLSP